MAFLNSALAFASSVPLKAPKGLWEWLLLTVFDFVKFALEILCNLYYNITRECLNGG